MGSVSVILQWLRGSNHLLQSPRPSEKGWLFQSEESFETHHIFRDSQGCCLLCLKNLKPLKAQAEQEFQPLPESNQSAGQNGETNEHAGVGIDAARLHFRQENQQRHHQCGLKPSTTLQPGYEDSDISGLKWRIVGSFRLSFKTLRVPFRGDLLAQAALVVLMVDLNGKVDLHVLSLGGSQTTFLLKCLNCLNWSFGVVRTFEFESCLQISVTNPTDLHWSFEGMWWTTLFKKPEYPVSSHLVTHSLTRIKIIYVSSIYLKTYNDRLILPYQRLKLKPKFPKKASAIKSYDFKSPCQSPAQVAVERRKSAPTCKNAENMFTLLALPVFLRWLLGLMLALMFLIYFWAEKNRNSLKAYWLSANLLVTSVELHQAREVKGNSTYGKTQGNPAIHLFLVFIRCFALAHQDRLPTLQHGLSREEAKETSRSSMAQQAQRPSTLWRTHFLDRILLTYEALPFCPSPPFRAKWQSFVK